MALTQVTSAIVKSVLSAIVDEWSLLITHANINKWSKYKPVRGNWPAGTTGKYGFNLPTNWDYLQPQGGAYAQPFRAGDFRGYEHSPANVMPPSWVNHATSSFAQTTVYDKVNYPEISGHLKLNDARATEITLSDLGYSGYYFGMKISQASHGTYWYKTLNTTVANNDWITADMSEPGDFPALINDGSDITVEFGISSQDRSATHTAPSVWIQLPHLTYNSIEMIGNHAMTLGLYIVASPSSVPEFDWFSDDNTPQVIDIDTDINEVSDVSGWNIKPGYPSWITIQVWNPIDLRVENPPYYEGLQLKVDTDEDNTGEYRSGSIILRDGSNNELETIAVYQGGGPADAFFHVDAGVTLVASSATMVTGSNQIPITFELNNFSSTSVKVYITVVKSDVVICQDQAHTARNTPYTQSLTVTLSENIIGGGDYHIYISKNGFYIP